MNTNLQNNIQNINRDFLEKEIEKKAKELNLSYVNFSKIALNSDFLRIITEKEASESQSVPFFQTGKKIRLGILNPNNPNLKIIVQDLREKGFMINFSLISEPSFNEGIAEYQRQNIKEEKKFTNEINEEDISTYENEIKNLSDLAQKIEEVKSDELLNNICVGSIKTKASDIHIEPSENEALVRFRIDGVMQKILSMPIKIYESLITQIKLNCKIKLNVKDIPQDGHFSFKISGRKVDVRVSSLPTEFGESFVMRVLDPNRKIMTFEDLGFTGETLKLIEETSQKSGGLILNTGPTGSEKTTTLYAVVRKINSPLNKIVTLEDPVEYELDGIAQSQINENKGYTFSSGLKALLRQDPDVVMVGEIRDQETAKIACQAAMTGHLVLSTLHTNSAAESVSRILNMGIKPFMLAPPLTAIIAQRLVRRPCLKCAEEKNLDKEEMNFLKEKISEIEKIQGGKISIPEKIKKEKEGGCDFCSHTGYHGRIAIIEILEINQKIKKMILESSSEDLILQYARENQKFLTFQEDGILKVFSGLTTLSEVRRVS